MTFRIIFPTIIMIILTSFNFSFASEEAAFNVATYNIRQINEEDSLKGNGWHRRAPMIAQLVKFHDFNIFGTQEGFKRQLDDLKTLLPGYEYIGIAREDGKNKGEHSAIFYDMNMFDLLDHGDFWLSETPGSPSLGWDAACIRICTWGKFRHKASGKIFQIFNLHLDHVGEKARVESVRLVQEKMKETGMDLPTFLMGDFNVDQTDNAYKVLSESGILSDSFEKSEMVYALNGTFNDYKTSGYTDSRIDHIFVTDNIEVDKYGILTDSYRTPSEDIPAYKTSDFTEPLNRNAYRIRLPSDHYPVKIRIKLR